MSKQIPIVIIGRTTKIGDTVTEILKPEYEVTHLFLTPESAKAEIPPLLGKEGKSPAAIVMGGGYTEGDFEDIKSFCTGVEKRGVSWVKVDPSKTPAGVKIGPEYASLVARRTKERLDELVRKQEIGDGKVYFV
ncbi:hypothetical protein BDV25DRAFT_135861 [Aspergillus avenaceus]|uniref:Uncharacterized protein n=1 Tax=Aspergillus avenaceus TaxID=36643 RepID=A0A5N6U710_ASPAV|nr:hypothetical protein BDV25DRAFT_135861 [Aspergillus avenaceus]